MDMAQQLGDVSLGLVKKTGGATPRFGIRFGKDEDMTKFAATQGLTEQASIGRYKITGTTPQMGPEGVKLMMQNSIQWDIREVLFMSDTATVVTALTNPSANKLALRRTGGTQTILHIKAMNAMAKEAFRKAKMTFRTADAEGEDQDTAKAIEEDDDAWHKRRVQQRQQSPKRNTQSPGGGLPPAQRPRLGTVHQQPGQQHSQLPQQQPPPMLPPRPSHRPITKCDLLPEPNLHANLEQVNAYCEWQSKACTGGHCAIRGFT